MINRDDELTKLLESLRSSSVPDNSQPITPELVPPTEIQNENFDPGEAQKIAVRLLRTIDREVGGILKNIKDDRRDITPLIIFLDNLLRTTDRQPTQGLLEAIVAAHRARADIDISSTRVLDSINKFIVATKNSSIIAPSVEDDISNDAQLRKLLDNPTVEDDN